MKLFICLFLTVCSYGQMSFTNVLARVGIEQRLNEQVPFDTVFRDEAGKTITLGECFKKKPVILALVYYGCPQLCTEVLNGLERSLRMITLSAGTDFDVVTISIDPSESAGLAAAKKQSYLKGYARAGSEAGWHCLTGEENSIRSVASAVGFHYYYDPGSKQFAHAAGIMVVSPSGRIARYFLGIDYSPKDLKMALVEAGQGRTGTRMEQLLLLCFHYDPATGKYGPAIIRIIRVAGICTVLTLGAMIGLMLRAERQRNRSPLG